MWIPPRPYKNSLAHLHCNVLFQVVTYFSNKGFQSHVDEVVISQVYRGRVSCSESDTWHGVPITVPPLPPTSKLENSCKLMEIEYRLDVSTSKLAHSENHWDLVFILLPFLVHCPFSFLLLLPNMCLKCSTFRLNFQSITVHAASAKICLQFYNLTVFLNIITYKRVKTIFMFFINLFPNFSGLFMYIKHYPLQPTDFLHL